MVFDELDVRVTADTGSFERGIDSAERSLSSFNPQALETAAALQVLQGRADEAGDELFDMAPRAATASAGLEGVSLSATGTSVAFSGLAITTVASLVPALVTLSSVLFPIIGALGGFVAIAGAIGGIGLAGALGAIAVNGERLKEEALATAAVFQDEFEPVIRTATAVLDILLGELADVASELVPSEEAISNLGGLFVNLGSAIIDLLPAFVELAVTLSREFLPGFVDFVNNVGPELPGIFDRLAGVFERLLPTLQAFGRWFVRFAPEFTEFGFTVLNTITPALSWFGRTLTSVTTAINDADRGIGSLIATGSILAPVLLGIATLLSGPVALAIGAGIAAVIGLRQAWQSNFAGIRDAVAQVGSFIGQVIPAIQESFSSFLAGANIPAIRRELVEWEDALRTQLMTTLEELSPVVDKFTQMLRDNQDEIAVIGGAVGFLVRGMINLSTALINVLGPAFRMIIIPVFSSFIDIIDLGLEKLSQFIQLAGAIKAGDFQQAVSEANQLFGGGPNPELNLDLPSAETSQRLEDRIEIVIDENTDITEARIESSADAAVRRRERRANRNTNTSYNPS